MNPNTSILIICSYGESLLNFRGDMIRDFIASGYKVFCAAPSYNSSTKKQLEIHGAECLCFPLQRGGLNPLDDFNAYRSLKRIIHKNEIDLVFPYTIKPVIYGSFAANSCDVPVISLITGLGFTFSGVSFKARFLQKVSEFLYRRALKRNKFVIFQNADDKQLFLDKEIISKSKKSAVVNGSGINLDRFKFIERKVSEGEPIKFVYVGRLIKEKGVALFMKTARRIKEIGGLAEFHLIGGISEQDASAVEEGEVKQLHDSGILISHGHVKDVKMLLSEMHVFVLPTYYREGVPRSILEALASGMPVITTNTPGCKETVIHGKNGYLIPPQEFEPLLSAVQEFLNDPDKVSEMGHASHDLAVSKFDVHLVNKQILKYVKEVLDV